MPQTSFNPFEHGFAFRNDFVNHVVTIPGAGIDFTTRGRCGGMAAAALDYWHSHLAVPDETSLPVDGTLLSGYIYDRLMQTILDNWSKNFAIMTSPDHPTAFAIGVGRATREQELPKLRSLLDAGIPQLIGVTRALAVDQFGNDHQVLAYGYETDARYTYVLAYDNNYPRQEVRLRLTTTYDPAEREITGAYGDVFRGLFVEAYAPQHPPFLVDGKLLSDNSNAAVFVIHAGGRFHVTSAQEFAALGYSWGDVFEAQDGSMAHVSTSPFNGTLAKERSGAAVYVTQGGRAFHIPSGSAFDAMGLKWSAVRTVPDGSMAGLPTTLRDRTLIREHSSAAVHVVEGGALRHVASAATFDALGFNWASVGVVPDGSLGGIPVGAPIP